MGWVVNTIPRPTLTPGKRPGTHRIGGWVGPGAGWDRRGISRPPPDFDPRTIQPVVSHHIDRAIRPAVTGAYRPQTLNISKFQQATRQHSTACHKKVVTPV